MCASKSTSQATNATKLAFSFHSRPLSLLVLSAVSSTSLIFDGYKRISSSPVHPSFLYFYTLDLRTKKFNKYSHDCFVLSKSIVRAYMSSPVVSWLHTTRARKSHQFCSCPSVHPKQQECVSMWETLSSPRIAIPLHLQLSLNHERDPISKHHPQRPYVTRCTPLLNPNAYSSIYFAQTCPLAAARFF